MVEENDQVHNQVAELLSAYIDDEVTADERALIESHLATCAPCARDLANLRQAVVLLRQLPQVAAPRPFTLRESDVMPMRPVARPRWWRLLWVQGMATAAAVLLCVVAVGGVLLLGRAGLRGAPAAPAPVALQVPAATEAPAREPMPGEEVAAEKAVEASAPAAAAVEEYRESARSEAEVVPEAQAEPSAGEGIAEAESMADITEAEAPAAAPTPQPAASPQTAREVAAPTPTRGATPEMDQSLAEETATVEVIQRPIGTPPPAGPTQPAAEEAQATSTSARIGSAVTGEPAPANTPTAAPFPAEQTPPGTATSAGVALPNTALLVGLCGAGAVALLLAGLVIALFLRARRR